MRKIQEKLVDRMLLKDLYNNYSKKKILMEVMEAECQTWGIEPKALILSKGYLISQGGRDSSAMLRDNDTIIMDHTRTMEQLIESLIHELTHVWQHTYAENMFDSYPYDSDNWEDYYYHPTEAHARMRASARVGLYSELL